jgi:hypothetical protein
MNPRIVLLACVLALLPFTVPSANAWGCKGHQTVALIAEKHLTPEARQMVQKLLGDNPIDPKLKRWCGNATSDAMADASTWPDDIRSERKNGPWHYIDIPRGKHKGGLEEYCGAEGCVTHAIEEQRAILKDKGADPVKRAEAMRYLIHFVGDMHQPLHAITNADNGGNCVPVKYFRREPLLNALHPDREDYSPNLHQIWDTEIVEARRLGSCRDSRGQLGLGEPRAGGEFRLRCFPGKDRRRAGHETKELRRRQPHCKENAGETSGRG